MFFLREGSVSLILEKYNNFEFLRVPEGFFFGEIELLFHSNKRYDTCLATQDCELLCLNKKDFNEAFMNKFREIGVDIAGNGYLR